MIISSRVCSESITDSKDMRVFYRPLGFANDNADVFIVYLGLTMHWNKCKTVFDTTPGHTDGSRGFTNANYPFTGDM